MTVPFGYLLGGCPVYLGGEGWAAEFWVTDGYITQFTLHFRSYAPNGEHTLLLPIDKAAAMLPPLPVALDILAQQGAGQLFLLLQIPIHGQGGQANGGGALDGASEDGGQTTLRFTQRRDGWPGFSCPRVREPVTQSR
mgnify:CR=1 FL=1